MQLALLLISSLLMLSIAYQDLRTRQVSILLFVGLWVGCIVLRSCSGISLARILIDIAVNFCLLFTIIGTTMLYFRFKNKERGFFDQLIGWGDIAFWCALTPCFSLPVFILLLLASLIFSLVLYLVVPFLARLPLGFLLSSGKNTEASIPLAGYQALFFTALFIVQSFLPLPLFEQNQNLLYLWTIS